MANYKKILHGINSNDFLGWFRVRDSLIVFHLTKMKKNPLLMYVSFDLLSIA